MKKMDKDLWNSAAWLIVAVGLYLAAGRVYERERVGDFLILPEWFKFLVPYAANVVVAGMFLRFVDRLVNGWSNALVQKQKQVLEEVLREHSRQQQL